MTQTSFPAMNAMNNGRPSANNIIDLTGHLNERNDRSNILFVFAATGGGHRASAAAVAEELEGLWPNTSVHLFDPTAVNVRHPLRRVLRLYGPVIRWFPGIWGWTYHMTDSATGRKVVQAIMVRLFSNSIRHAIVDLRPSIVLSFHALLTDATRVAAAQQSAPCGVVITDLTNIHPCWTGPGFDLVCAPTQEVAKQALALGTPETVVKTLGLPINSSFSHQSQNGDERSELRKLFDLPSTTVVLLMGGGEGAGPLYDQAQTLIRTLPDVFVVVLCGRNKRLLKRVTSLAARHPGRLKAVGLVDNVASWIRAADVVATKAGPGAIAEALAIGTPLILTGALPGQEAHNVDYVVDAGAGLFAATSDALAEHVKQIMNDKTYSLRLNRQATQLAATGAAQDIAEAIVLVSRREVKNVATKTIPSHARRRTRHRPKVAVALAGVGAMWWSLTFGANAAVALDRDDTSLTSNTQYVAVRVTSEQLQEPAVVNDLIRLHPTVVVDEETAAANPESLKTLLAANIEIANGGSAQSHQHRWNRARNDIESPEQQIARESGKRVRLFIPERRVDGSDLYYAMQTHQTIVSGITIVHPSSQQTPPQNKYELLIDARGDSPASLATYLDTYETQCKNAGLSIASIGSLHEQQTTDQDISTPVKHSTK